jgi:serine/threonine protein kinase/tetratricopeptide (TPR) repeat protein
MHQRENPVSMQDGPVEAALAEYFTRLDRGESVDLTKIIAAHPGCEAGVHQFLNQERKLQMAVVEAPPVAAPPENHAGRELGDFRILRVLGQGGMGIVYEAEQISLGRRVALKVLPSAVMLGKQQLARFKNEARAAATLDHPNIVPVYSVGSEGGVHYYAMQLIEGPSLAQVFSTLRRAQFPSEPAAENSLRDGALSTDAARLTTELIPSAGPGAPELQPADMVAVQPVVALPDFQSREFYRAIARLGIQAAEALDHAHQNGILHRDIKPGNLMLDAGGKLYVTDFGLARIEADVGMTMTGDIIGTLRYMAPEQALAKRAVVDHRGDIYSLGATLYELLTLHPVFTGKDRQELLRQIAFEEPTKPRLINRRIPDDLETIVLKAMEKEPGDRYATAREVANDLQRFLASEPICAKLPTAVQQLVKWSRRHVAAVWAATVASVAIAMVLLVSTSIVAHWYREASAQRLAAAGEATRAEAALVQSEKARREADLEREQAEGVTAFVVQSLTAHDPYSGGKQDLTVADAMMQAVDRLDQGELAGQPDRVAYLLEHISMILYGNGRTAEAERLAERSYQIRGELYGEDDEATVRSLNNLAGLLMRLGRFSEAEPLFEKVLAAYQRIYAGQEHPHLAWAMNNLAGVRNELGRTEEAAPLFEQALKLERRRLDNRDDPSIVRGLHNLAGARKALGDETEAEELYEEALAMSKRLHPGDDPLVAHCLNSLAALHQSHDRLDRSEPLWEEALQMRQRLFQGDHPDVATSMNNLAWAYRKRSQLDKAESLYLAALDMFRRLYPGDHPSTVRCLTNLAYVRIDQGRLDEAEVLFADALAMARRTNLPADHEYVRVPTEELAKLRETLELQNGTNTTDDTSHSPAENPASSAASDDGP